MTSQLIQRVTLSYLRLVAALFILSPVAAVVFVQFCVPADLLFIDHGFHEIAIAGAVAISLFLAYLSYRCHRESGEALSRYLALGYLAFGLLYAPHGALTHLAHTQPALFLLWGPVARLAMAAFVLWGILYGAGRATTGPQGGWAAWLSVFLAIALVTAWVALTQPLATVVENLKTAIRFSVQDSGCGIPLDKQTEIFEEFVQIGNAERDRANGLGLGLAIVRRLAELLGANIGVTSQTNVGSCFWVDLPVVVGQREAAMDTGEQN